LFGFFYCLKFLLSLLHFARRCRANSTILWTRCVSKTNYLFSFFSISLLQPLLSRQLASGSFLQDLLAALLSDSRRFSLFSAHDDTVRALLFALFVGETQRSDWPAYASHIALERWTNTTGNTLLAL
jgi:hypothetical protein